MKLIKLKNDHYIIVDDSEIKEGDWYYWEITKTIQIAKLDSLNRLPKNSDGSKKITHSTEPLDVKITDEGIHLPDWSKVKALSPRVVKELIGEVDIWQKFKEIDGSCQKGEYEHWLFESGYNQAIEDNKEKKYTEEDLKYMFECGRNYQNNAEITFRVSMEYLQQSKTEWEVEFIDGKLKLK